jgi:hypothetical protein
MKLNNLINKRTGNPMSILVRGDHIVSVKEELTEREPFTIQFNYATVIPGLINSHDHLDFNCFQPLGTSQFKNYTEWGHEIHRNFREDIQAVLNIPQNLRTEWGLYKNLICGVTTVIHHGPLLNIKNSPIHVFQDLQNLHSTAFEKNWIWKLNNPFLGRKMVVIHAGEGTDPGSEYEIDELIKYNFLRRDIIGIHGVAMNSSQAKKMKALVWCPQSNQMLLNKQPVIQELKKHIPILFGTDSTLTSEWDIWQHIRYARSLRVATDEELFDMCTRAPAVIWGLNRGELQPGREADLIVVKCRTRRKTWDFFFETSPEDILMVIRQGEIRLFDESLLPQVKNNIKLENFSCVTIGNSKKRVEGDLPVLAEKIKSYHQKMTFPFPGHEPMLKIENIG